MKSAYPVVFTKTERGYVVYVPDFDCNTEGADLPEAIAMARDVIGAMGIDREDDKLPLPASSDVSAIRTVGEQFVSVVDIDFAEYRRAFDNRTVRRNVTLPYWLDVAAKQSNINVSAVLQNALKQELQIRD